MADIFDVADTVCAMADGFERAVAGCLSDHAEEAASVVREQMYSGMDGEGKFLSPTYDTDPYFSEKGPWQGRAADYKKWKAGITPPKAGTRLNLPPRPLEIPNLFINGQFYSEVFSAMQGDILSIDALETGNGPDIVAKYGGQLLMLSPQGIGYFNSRYVLPRIWEFFGECGY